jgi:predicted tellurium resistance membrane protein TerC
MPPLSFEWLADPQGWGALLTLSLLEIVLGIDNIVFLSILVDRLPQHQRKSGRLLGLGLAMFARLALLLSITWIMSLTKPLFSFHLPQFLWDLSPHYEEHQGILGISVKDLILLVGGGFLIWKATKEIHHKLESVEENNHTGSSANSFVSVLIQIAMIDIVFSLDSVITAVGMVNDPTRISLMMTAVIISVAVMMLASGAVGAFVSRHPSIKMLALSFLILIGTTLMAEAFHFHFPKGYIYFAMAFSLGVEFLNIRTRSKNQPAPAAEI